MFPILEGGDMEIKDLKSGPWTKYVVIYGTYCNLSDWNPVKVEMQSETRIYSILDSLDTQLLLFSKLT